MSVVAWVAIGFGVWNLPAVREMRELHQFQREVAMFTEGENMLYVPVKSFSSYSLLVRQQIALSAVRTFQAKYLEDNAHRGLLYDALIGRADKNLLAKAEQMGVNLKSREGFLRSFGPEHLMAGPIRYYIDAGDAKEGRDNLNRFLAHLLVSGELESWNLRAKLNYEEEKLSNLLLDLIRTEP
jgi:hypothetical protein